MRQVFSPRFYILKPASFSGVVDLLMYPPNRKYTLFFPHFFFHSTTSLLGPCHPFSERSGTHLTEDGEVQSQGNCLHKPQGRTEGLCWGVSLISRIRRMCHFVLFPSSRGLGIAGKLGLSVSLSAYKDKYVTEVRTETFRGDDRCAVKSRALKTFEAIWCASLAAAATVVSLPTSTCACV